MNKALLSYQVISMSYISTQVVDREVGTCILLSQAKKKVFVEVGSILYIILSMYL